MLASRGPLPIGAQWTYEVKWDGMRLLADLHDGSARLTSRNGRSVAAAFPELVRLAEMGRDALLDGEVVAFDADGLPHFDRLTERIGVTSPVRAAALATTSPVTYVMFDLLRLDGQPLLDHSYWERRRLLAGLALPDGPWLVPHTFADGEALVAATKKQGLEGVVAKRWDSPYRPGVRSTDWVKLSHRSGSDAVVVGWRAHTGHIRAVAVAQPGPGGGWVFRGTAGSGLSAAKSAALLPVLRARPVGDPAALAGLSTAEAGALEGYHWVQPGVVVEIEHLGMTEGGRFRQPVVARVRPDLDVTGSADGGKQPDPHAVRAAVGGRTLRLSHLDKVLYPATGTTKAEVVEYFTAVAPQLLPLAADRPVTRRRWPDGVAAQSFFEKNLPAWAPEWIRRVQIPTSQGSTTFPVLAADDVAALVWLAAHAALELHTPQWRIDADGRQLPPDRLVIDLDPGAPAGLADCARIALAVREALAADGLAGRAVLSGSKGLHIYAPLDGSLRLPVGADSDAVTGYVRGLAERLAAERPTEVVAVMTKSARRGRVFLDWSQNRSAKTTLAPWSLRGTAAPFAAVPVAWEEVAAGNLRQVQLSEVMAVGPDRWGQSPVRQWFSAE
jgi:bifunctional non-homologous end joining protein LigD